MKSPVYLRPLLASDEAAFLQAVRLSRRVHHPWVSPPATAHAFREYLDAMAPPVSIAFAVVLQSTDALVGVINLTQIVRGCFQNAYIGYYVFAGYERQGLMREGLRLVARHAFGTLKLHRLEANIQPNNAASLALVAACGFRKEGYSPRYLKIRGRWRDHERWAICATD